MVYDLEERTSKFGEDVIGFARKIRIDFITETLLKQIVRSATSVGANYREANSGSSDKDFKNKIYICQKEANETKHWLQMIVKACPETAEEARILWKEANEITLIFGKTLSTLKNKQNQ